MATILQPTIEFTNNNSQNRARVSFDVRFLATELGGGAPSSWTGRFPGLIQPNFPKPTISHHAQVVLKVIRIVPQPFVQGDPPPPLPDPVTLQVNTVNVKLPTSGNTRSVETEFRYTLVQNNPFVFDHLHAVITLFRRLRFGSTNLFTIPVDTKTTNDLVLAFDLASPQPNGVVIPS